MAAKIKYRITGLIAILFLVSGIACKDLFKNPLKDKETGEDVTLLLLDRNFITTKISVRVEDLATQQVISEPVEIRFTGNDSDNLITFGGNKKTTFTTSSGFVEVGYDPNQTVNAQNPIELTVVASNANYISAPLFVSYTSEGIKDLTIKMYMKSKLKSAKIAGFDEPFGISYNGQLQSSGLHFIADLSSSPTGTAWEYKNLYSATVAGNLGCSNLKDAISYSDFGAYFYSPNEGTSVMPPATPVKTANLQSGDYIYSAVLRSGVSKCSNGLTIHVSRPNGEAGSGVFNYLITFSNGKTMSGKVSCTFPSDNVIEPIYYSTSNPAVKVELFGDLQYDLSQAVNLTSPCDGKANFTATPKSGLKTYKLITRYSCPNSSVGMGLSVIGEFRKKGSTDVWTSFKFIEGICILQLVGGQDYEFRVNIDSDYYYYELPTDPDKVKSFIENDKSADFKFRNLAINVTESEVLITTDVEFSQAVCDIIQ
jgi:hypothetical protein